MTTATLTPAFKPGDRVITQRHGRGIITSVYGAALLVQTLSGPIVASARTVKRDDR